MNGSKKKHKVLKIVIITLVVLIALVITFGVICVALAVQDPYKDKYSTTDTVKIDADLVADIAKAAVFGKEYTADDQEVNSYIRKNLDSNLDSKLKDLAIYFHDGNKAEIYGRVHLDISSLNYKGDFGFYCASEFNLNKEDKILEIKLSNAKLGMLPIHDSILEKVIADTLKDKIQCKNTVIYLPISLETEIEGVDIKVALEEFCPNEGSVSLKSNKILADTLDSATDKAKEWIKEHKNQLHEYGDDMILWIDENHDKLNEYESQAENWIDNNHDTISEYGNKLEQWANENSDTISRYTDKAKGWLSEHIN